MSSYPNVEMSQSGQASVRSADSPGAEGSQQNSASSRKRASRAGTRSVNTLSPLQLERKRANDREAQRAIRQRTKDHIEGLERKINDLTATSDNQERLIAALQQQVRDLIEENSYLKTRPGGYPSSMLQVPGDGGSFNTTCYLCVSACSSSTWIAALTISS